MTRYQAIKSVFMFLGKPPEAFLIFDSEWVNMFCTFERYGLAYKLKPESYEAQSKYNINLTMGPKAELS